MDATHRRKRRAPAKRNPGSDLRKDVREAIELAWPSGMVEMAFDSDESWIWDVYPKLSSAMRRIKGSHLVREREPDGGPVWFDGSDPEEPPADDQEPSRSYHLFFVCPEGDAFAYETEIESPRETGLVDDGENELSEGEMPMETVAGKGRTGWSVAVSLVAPFAVITLSDMESFEDGSFSEPAIESHWFDETGQRMDRKAEFLKLKGEHAFQILLNLRVRICDALDKHAIGVLPDTEWRKPVPWLWADEGVFAGTAGEPLRVLDALFFKGF